MNDRVTTSWWIWGKSVRGVTHQLQNKPLQDAWGQKTEEGFSVLAVADGHGSTTAPYSAIGARLAVETACDVFTALYHSLIVPDASLYLNMAQRYRLAKLQIPRDLRRRWQDTVLQLHLESDVTNNDLKVSDILRLYGTTLLTVFVTDNFAILSQIGDGAILVVEEDGTVSQPIPRDQRLLGVETTSLAGKYAEQDFKISLLMFEPSSPMLFLVCSDGYVNSFESDEDFHMAGIDYLDRLHKYGAKYIQENLEEWLTQTSKQGSGDDVTVAFIWSQQQKLVDPKITVEKGSQENAQDAE